MDDTNLTSTQITNKININSEFIRFYERQYNNPFRDLLLAEKIARRKELILMLDDPKVWCMRCATCGTQDKEAFHFKDELSITEFKISGMCQRCQDGTEKYLKRTSENNDK